MRNTLIELKLEEALFVMRSQLLVLRDEQYKNKGFEDARIQGFKCFHYNF